MTTWKKTSCILCAQNCGLEVQTEGSRITKVRPDKGNPRSEGYVCRKGMSIAYFQNQAQRLTHPLKKVGDKFVKVSWDEAVDEISDRLKAVLDSHGSRALAYMGGGGQGCHFEAAFGRTFLTALGSQYHYNAIAQELTGMFWVNGRVFGKQYIPSIPDDHETDMLVSVGWTGWMSNQMPQTRRHLKRISDDPDKLLVVIDPRMSETAERANIHLPIRPGTDALFARAAISIVLKEGWHDQEYVEKHVTGFEEILHLFKDFDAKAASEVCGLEYEKVEDFARLFASRNSSVHTDLGMFMNRHSTVTSYLWAVLTAICGRACVRGGNIIPGCLMPIGSHSDERDERTWRTTATDFPAIMGYFPPNVMPEEILSGRDDRLRAVIVSGANPLRSYADTSAYEKAFSELDLLVTVEVAMSETAQLSHYVLPARSAYEKWDSSFFAWNFPEVYFQLRRPVCKPVGDCLEESEIFIRLSEKLGLVPEIPDDLKNTAAGERANFMLSLMDYLGKNPSAMKMVPVIVARTLGPVLGSNNLAALWGLLQTAPPSLRENAARAGFDPGPGMGEEIFKALLDKPEGIWIGKCDPENNLDQVKTEDGRINVSIPELYDWVRSIDAASEEKALAGNEEYPFILLAGHHMDMNANTVMRDPAWNKGRRACTMMMHPSDADALNFKDGQKVKVETEVGAEEVELEVTDKARPGQVIIPHGFGLIYQGEKYGANVNRLTKNTYRDPLAATPLHRYVPCRVNPLEG